MERVITSVIIPAAGQGSRMQASVNKPYLLLDHKPVLAYTLDAFEQCPLIDEIILVINQSEFEICRREVLKPYRYTKVKLVAGGRTRQESVYHGLLAVSAQTDMVMTHDGARPLIEEAVIAACIAETAKYQATVVGVPAKNTIKIIDDQGLVKNTPDRNYLVEIQTPQTFDLKLLKKAHEQALAQGLEGTDDAFLVEQLGVPVKVVIGDYANIKITTPEDLVMAEAIIRQRQTAAKSSGKN